MKLIVIERRRVTLISETRGERQTLKSLCDLCQGSELSLHVSLTTEVTVKNGEPEMVEVTLVAR